MGLYDRTFKDIDAFERRWSPIRVVGAIVVIAAAFVGMVLLASQLGELTTDARAATEDSALVRSRVFGGLGPFIVVLALGVVVILAIRYLFTGARPWHLRNGPLLRRRHHGYYGGDATTVDALYERFRTGDPAVYTPLPEKVDGGHVDLTIWTADEARYGLIGLSYGQKARTTRNAPPLTFEGEYYDALDAALKNRMRAQAPR